MSWTNSGGEVLVVRDHVDSVSSFCFWTVLLIVQLIEADWPVHRKNY